MPTPSDELLELRDRITRLRLDEQLYLFELVLGEYRRQVEEARARLSGQIEVSWEAERKQQGAALPKAA